MTYERLSVVEFGNKLFETGDLDPIYVMLNDIPVPWETTARFSLAYWCFYHAGFAAFAADADDFWDVMNTASNNVEACPVTEDKRWPRGTERRHFRGVISAKAINHLRKHYPDPIAAIRYLKGFDTPPLSFETVATRVKNWPGFGPWIAFKIADMLDAVLAIPVDFEGTEEHFFDDPKLGALWVAGDYNMPLANLTQIEITQNVVAVLRDIFVNKRVGHPPRPPGTQEIETVLCKWKSHLNGKYPVGKDTKEIIHGLEAWAPHSNTARLCMLALKMRATQAGVA
jgi:hypothetical protein